MITAVTNRSLSSRERGPKIGKSALFSSKSIKVSRDLSRTHPPALPARSCNIFAWRGEHQQNLWYNACGRWLQDVKRKLFAVLASARLPRTFHNEKNQNGFTEGYFCVRISTPDCFKSSAARSANPAGSDLCRMHMLVRQASNLGRSARRAKWRQVLNHLKG